MLINARALHPLFASRELVDEDGLRLPNSKMNNRTYGLLHTNASAEKMNEDLYGAEHKANLMLSTGGTVAGVHVIE